GTSLPSEAIYDSYLHNWIEIAFRQGEAPRQILPSEETSRRWGPAGVVLKRTGNVSTASLRGSPRSEESAAIRLAGHVLRFPCEALKALSEPSDGLSKLPTTYWKLWQAVERSPRTIRVSDGPLEGSDGASKLSTGCRNLPMGYWKLWQAVRRSPRAIG